MKKTIPKPLYPQASEIFTSPYLSNLPFGVPWIQGRGHYHECIPVLLKLCATRFLGSILFLPPLEGLKTEEGGSFQPRSFVMLYVRIMPPLASETIWWKEKSLKSLKLLNYDASVRYYDASVRHCYRIGQDCKHSGT